MSEQPSVKKDNKIEWHPQQAKLLKSWAEVASSYRWMHNQAYMIYKKKNLNFMLPLIVMSTVTGTANFAQSTFPESIRSYVPQIIGAINLVSAIMTTIYQFLKISEFMESHRISSINYGKLARTITVELNLPVKDRNSGGAECVKVCRTEIDRLIEQSPTIPKNVLFTYERQFAGRGLSEPEIVVINKVDIYEDIENKTATTVAEAGLKLKNLLKKPFIVNNKDSPTTRKNKEFKQESESLSGKFISVFSELKNKLSDKKEFKIPEFQPIPPQQEPQQPPGPSPYIQQSVEIQQENVEDIHNDKVTQENNEVNNEVNDIIENLVNETVQTTQTISDDLEALRSSKIVTNRVI